jgi:hypothetical protein
MMGDYTRIWLVKAAKSFNQDGWNEYDIQALFAIHGDTLDFKRAVTKYFWGKHEAARHAAQPLKIEEEHAKLITQIESDILKQAKIAGHRLEAMLSKAIKVSEGYKKRYARKVNEEAGIREKIIKAGIDLGGASRSTILADIKYINGDGFFKYANIQDEAILFNTGTVTISHNGRSCVLGPFLVEVDLLDLKVKVSGTGNAVIVHSEFVHPHVSSSGTPCFGTAQGAYRRAAQCRDLKGIMRMVQAVLTQYNLGSPYRNFEEFYVRQPNIDLSELAYTYREAAERIQLKNGRKIKSFDGLIYERKVIGTTYTCGNKYVRYADEDNITGYMLLGDYLEKIEQEEKEYENSNTTNHIPENTLPSVQLP